MKKKTGRPPVPKREGKSRFRGTFFAADELKQSEKESEKRGLDKSKWMREATKFRVDNPPVWVSSKWKREELNGKLIAFRLRSPERTLEGVGELSVIENDRGQIAVDIFINESVAPNQGILTRIWLSQEAVDRIEAQAEPNGPPFKLFG